jgi:uncharacterized protein YciU (UPF0263 family)
MNWFKIAQALETVVLKGKLKQTDDGFVYLDINDDLMKGLFPLIDKDGIDKPPYFNKKFNEVGAHVSIISGNEIGDSKIKEVGKDFNFELGDFKSTDPDGWDEMKKVYFVQIHSKELEDLRAKYGLTKKKDGHEFHITIAVEKA